MYDLMSLRNLEYGDSPWGTEEKSIPSEVVSFRPRVRSAYYSLTVMFQPILDFGQISTGTPAPCSLQQA